MVWSRGARLGKAEWAERMLGRDSGDRVAGMLRVAALGAASGSSHAEGRQASEALAGAMQVVGLDHWPRFVADAQARASIQAKAGDDFAARPGGLTPVPFVDDMGQVVLNQKGMPMMRPAGMDPTLLRGAGSCGQGDRSGNAFVRKRGRSPRSICLYDPEVIELQSWIWLGRSAPWWLISHGVC